MNFSWPESQTKPIPKILYFKLRSASHMSDDSEINSQPRLSQAIARSYFGHGISMVATPFDLEPKRVSLWQRSSFVAAEPRCQKIALMITLLTGSVTGAHGSAGPVRRLPWQDEDGALEWWFQDSMDSEDEPIPEEDEEMLLAEEYAPQQLESVAEMSEQPGNPLPPPLPELVPEEDIDVDCSCGNCGSCYVRGLWWCAEDESAEMGNSVQGEVSPHDEAEACSACGRATRGYCRLCGQPLCNLPRPVTCVCVCEEMESSGDESCSEEGEEAPCSSSSRDSLDQELNAMLIIEERFTGSGA